MSFQMHTLMSVVPHLAQWGIFIDRAAEAPGADFYNDCWVRILYQYPLEV